MYVIHCSVQLRIIGNKATSFLVKAVNQDACNQVFEYLFLDFAKHDGFIYFRTILQEMHLFIEIGFLEDQEIDCKVLKEVE